MPAADQPAITPRLRTLLYVPSGIAIAVVCGVVWTLASDPAGEVRTADSPRPVTTTIPPAAAPSLALVPTAPPAVLASNARKAAPKPTTPAAPKQSAHATWAAATTPHSAPAPPAPATATADQGQNSQGDNNQGGQPKPGGITIVREFGGYALTLVRTVAAPVTSLLGD